jgi:hypothetical protein
MLLVGIDVCVHEGEQAGPEVGGIAVFERVHGDGFVMGVEVKTIPASPGVPDRAHQSSSSEGSSVSPVIDSLIAKRVAGDVGAM